VCRIKVAAVFENGVISPVKFRHAGRDYKVDKITYRWTTRNGASKIYHFAVYDGANTFEISFDDKNTLWELKTE
jgi:hypothetical protein